jgi:protein-arginine kinase activator protein McsA
MNKDEIDTMWQKAMQESIKDGEMYTRYHFAKLVAERALADPMREVQRLGQEIEQEPVALPCCGYTDASAVKWNPLNRIVQCHNCGQTYTPPQRTEQNFCSRCGKRTKDLTHIHTCTPPPQENT